MVLEGIQLGRYQIIRLLGSGGMGEVYLAEDARIEQQVAIKVIRGEVHPYPHAHVAQEAARLFQREAKAIAKLDHPHILPLFDYGEESLHGMTLIYLVMPFRQEGSLADWLRQRDGADMLSPQQVAHVVKQAAEALHHAHTHQIIHQDVKPSNFLVRSSYETPDYPDVLLADFGIAKLMTTNASKSHSVRGTPTYMSPEQSIGVPVPASDQYALAIMAYELLTGRPPFQGGVMHVMYQHLHDQPQPPSTFNGRLSTEVDAVLLHALAKTPTDRFDSITAFATAFHQAATDTDVPTMVKTPRASSAPGTQSEDDIHITIPSQSREMHTIALTDSTFVPMPTPPQVPTADAFSMQGTNKAVASDEDTSSLAIRTGIRNRTPNTGDTPLPVLNRGGSRRRTKRRMLAVVLEVLAVLIVFGSVTFAAPGTLAYLASFVFGSASHSSLAAGMATVTITPVSAPLKKDYTIVAVTGTPDLSKHQVQARNLSLTTQSNSQTVKATGVGQLPPTHAVGILTIHNNWDSKAVFPPGTVYSDANGIQVATSLAATIPAYTTVNVPAHVVQAGTHGNILANDIQYSDDFFSIWNPAAFTGGQDAQTYSVVQKSDINGATSALTAHTPNAQQVLQGQVHSHEQFVGTPSCNPNVYSNYAAGTAATSVTVWVSFICTGEVYDHDGALAMAAQWLKHDAAQNPGTSYVLVGNIVTTQTGAPVSGPNQTISLSITAAGVWVYQFSNAQMQALAQLIAGKRKQDALTQLSHQVGVSHADLQISGGDGNTLPTDPKQIKLVVQSVPGM